MQLSFIHDYCMAKKGVEETLPFGPDTLVYKVMGKAFLLTGIDTEVISFNVKCDPDKAVELREQYECVQPGYHMNKKHWNTINCNQTVSLNLIKQWIDDSYQLVVNGLTKSQKTILSKL
jgi:predicted DNA-binding protein (MmcQ/YjbR family)